MMIFGRDLMLLTAGMERVRRLGIGGRIRQALCIDTWKM